MKEIIVNKDEEKKTIILLEDGNIVEKYIEYKNSNKLEGNIYIGKIESILPGMQAAFIDIGLKKNTFIHLKDILPRENVVEGERKYNKEDIKNITRVGQPILVQVKRDFTNSKGAKVSTHINLNSRYIVLLPNTTIVTTSLKIEDEKEKERLTNIVKKYLPENCGAIVRTSAENQKEEVIKKDIEVTLNKWQDIEKLYNEKLKNNNYPRVVYKTHGVLKRLLLDLIDRKLEKITVNDKEEYEYVQKLLEQFEEKIELVVKENQDIIGDSSNLSKQLEKSEKRKVWLKCGGFIAIDKTEALTAIDVNSGKYIGKDNVESTIFKVNKEASIEIARQLRLRDIGGIVIIDYIDKNDEENKEKILEILNEELKKDRSKTQVVGFSKLNLLEMTRKHLFSNN